MRHHRQGIFLLQHAQPGRRRSGIPETASSREINGSGAADSSVAGEEIDALSVGDHHPDAAHILHQDPVAPQVVGHVYFVFNRQVLSAKRVVQSDIEAYRFPKLCRPCFQHGHLLLSQSSLANVAVKEADELIDEQGQDSGQVLAGRKRRWRDKHVNQRIFGFGVRRQERIGFVLDVLHHYMFVLFVLVPIDCDGGICVLKARRHSRIDKEGCVYERALVAVDPLPEPFLDAANVLLDSRTAYQGRRVQVLMVDDPEFGL